MSVQFLSVCSMRVLHKDSQNCWMESRQCVKLTGQRLGDKFLRVTSLRAQRASLNSIIQRARSRTESRKTIQIQSQEVREANVRRAGKRNGSGPENRQTGWGLLSPGLQSLGLAVMWGQVWKVLEGLEKGAEEETERVPIGIFRKFPQEVHTTVYFIKDIHGSVTKRAWNLH